ncbi:MAG: hypothetical protein ACR2PT_23740 [Endozoicomonas sp.]
MTKWILLLALVTTTVSSSELEDKECEAVAIAAYMKAKKDNPGMDSQFYAAIGSHAYDQCIAEKQKKTEAKGST